MPSGTAVPVMRRPAEVVARRRRLGLAIAPAVFLASLSIGVARAQDLEEEVGDPRIGEPGILFLDALLELDLEYRRDFDLDRDEGDDVRAAEPQVSLFLTFAPTEWFYAFLETGLSVDFERLQGEDSTSDASLAINQAYVGFTDLLDEVSIQLGRQDFEDERAWLLDEALDGVRVLYEPGDLTFDLSVTRLNAVDRDLFDDDEEEDERINNYILLAHHETLEDVLLGGYVIVRDDRSDEEGRPVFIGLQSHGEALEDLTHWVELGHVRGDDGERDIRGWGLDLGATYELDLPLSPRLSLGYAWGSGDADPVGSDGSFRQTGLQSNEWWFGDSAEFKYYGEAFDPELSNLHVVTVGVGISPTDQFALDLVYHYYRQDTLAGELRDAAFTLEPNQDPARLSKDLGHEIDLIARFDPLPNLELAIALGTFLPGRAFRVEDEAGFRSADPAFLARFEVDYLF